jgi:hypothetical protein
VNTRELAEFQDWDERALQELVVRYVRTFHRFPSRDQLVRFRSARGQLQLRIPRRGGPRRATLVATL